MNKSGKLFGATLGLIAVNSLTVASFNYVIDPYNVIAGPKVAGINAVKNRSSEDARRFKAINVIRKQPQTIFLGNSRTDIGLDADHPAIGQPAYNLAIPAGNMYETMRYFQHALANQPDLNQVVIGIEFVMFEEREGFDQLDPVQASRLETTNYLQHLPSLMFSTDTFKASLSTLHSNITAQPAREQYLDNGRLIRVNPPELTRLQVFETHLKSAFFNNWYKDYHISPQQIAAFQTIVETCRQRGIELHVFISPAHAAQWEAVRAAGLWSTFEEWKRQIVAITPVWDFSGYNSITTEPIAEEMQYYLESSHYVKEIGDLVLNRIFNSQTETVPVDFGSPLTAENVTAHLNRIRAERQSWASQNAELVTLVQQWHREVQSAI